MKMLWIILFVLANGLCHGQDQWKNIYRESAWEERDSWQKAPEIIKRMGLREGNSVADIGSHEGYMTMKLSKAVGLTGKVYAVDVDQSKLDLLKAHLNHRKVENVSVVKGEYDDPKLIPNTLDAVVILDTYHEMDDHDKILQHVQVALRTGGRLVLCEPLDPKRKDLTRAEQEAKHELGINFALADLKKAGFEIVYQKDPFVDRTAVKGDKMWLIVAVKK